MSANEIEIHREHAEITAYPRICMHCGRRPATRGRQRMLTWMPAWYAAFAVLAIVGVVLALLLQKRQRLLIWSCNRCVGRRGERMGEMMVGFAALAALGLWLLAMCQSPLAGAFVLQLALFQAARALTTAHDVRVKRIDDDRVTQVLDNDTYAAAHARYLQQRFGTDVRRLYPRLADVRMTLCHRCGQANDALHEACTSCRHPLDPRAAIWTPLAA